MKTFCEEETVRPLCERDSASVPSVPSSRPTVQRPATAREIRPGGERLEDSK